MQKQVVPLSFEQGVNTKGDKKQQVFGQLRKAENIVFDTANLLKKRNGYDLLQPRKSDDTLAAATALAKFNNELLLLEQGALFGYSSALNRLTDKGNLYAVSLDSATVVNNTYTHEQVDCLYLEGLEVFVYRNSGASEIRYSVRDASSKSFLVADVLIGSGELPRVANIENQVFVLWVDGTALKKRSFSIVTPETLSAASTIFSDVDASAQLDVASGSSKIFVAYNSSNVGEELTIFSLDSGGTASTAIGVTGSEAPNALDLLIDDSGRLVVTFADATAIYYLIMPGNLGAALLAATSIDTVADVMSCTAQVSGSDYLVYYSVAGATYNSNIVNQVTVQFDGTVGSTTALKRGVSLASKQFLIDDEPYVLVNFTSPLQATYFLLNGAGTAVAKISPTNGGGEVSTSLPHVASISDSEVLLPTLVKTRLDVDSSTFYSVEGVNGTVANFSPDHSYQNTLLGNNLVIAGGITQLYDGDTVAEHGFSVYPESIAQATQSISVTPATTQAGDGIVAEIQTLTYSATPGAGSFTLTYGAETTAAIAYNANNAAIKAAIEALAVLSVTVTVTGSFAAGHTLTYDIADGNVAQPTATTSLTLPLSGGALSDGTYEYVALYKWTDNYGQEHRSPVSPSVAVTLAGGGATQQCAVTVPTLRLTDKSNVVIELYRTEDAGTVFYKVSSNSSPTYSSTSADTVTITDLISDAALISREPLYTTGSVLENTAPPSAKYACTWLERVVLAGLEDGNMLEISKYRDDGKPVEFSDLLRMPVAPIGGKISAVAALNEKLIIFQPSACLYMVGDGPNNLGEQNTWTTAEVISTDVGCAEPGSIVYTKHGLMFKSAKGIYLLDAGLSLTYIGEAVEDFNDLTVTSAAIIADKNQVRFTTSDGPALVYNYEQNKWSTFTNHAALSAIVVDGSYYYLRQDSSLFKENSSSFADNGVPIRLLVETGWLSFASLQGFMRAYKLMVLGEFKSAHSLRLQVGYDFNEAWVQERQVPLSDILDTSTYGSGVTYGSDTPYGGPGTPYQIRFDLKKQKCQALKLRLSDVQSTAGQGLTLSAVTFEVGGKSGMFKPAQTQVKGTR